MEITNTFLNQYRISKDFTIQLDNGKEVNINKYINEDEFNNDADWEFTDEESKKIYEELDEEQQDELYNFINEIKL
jgi:hypothetical protein